MAGDEDIGFKIYALIDGLKDSMSQASSSVKDFANDAKSSVEGISGTFEQMKGVLETVAEAFGGYELIKTMVEWGNATAEAGEKLERMASITGLTTDELQNFQFAVKLTGGDSDSAAQSLLRFENNLAKAQQGAGPAAAAYEAMGISLKDANGQFKDVQQILNEVSQKFSETADGATKVEYATALGSRGFVQMISVLDKGPEALKEFNDKLAQTNSKMSVETVVAAAQTAEKLKELDTSWVGLKEHLVDQSSLSNLYGLLNDITQATTKGVIAFKEWADAKPGGGLLNGGHVSSDDEVSQAKAYTQMKTQQAKPALAPLPQPGQDGTDDSDAIQKEQSQTALELSHLTLEGKKQDLDAEVDAGRMTQQQKIAALEDYAQKDYATEMSILDDEKNSYDEGTKEYQAALDKELIATQKYKNDLAKLNADSAKQQQEQANQMTATIQRAFDGMLTGVLQGTQTWQQAMAKLFDNLAITFIEAAANMAVKWAVGEAMKAAASVTGAALSTAAWSGANTTGLAEQAAAGKSSVGMSAGQAAASVYADVAAIPYVGWLLAPPAAAAAFVAVEAFGADFSAAGGFDIPAGVNPVTQLHAQEMVLPANLANSVRNMTAGGGGGGSNGAQVTINVSAIDTQSGLDFINTQAENIASVINSQIRNGNPALSGSALSTGRF